MIVDGRQIDNGQTLTTDVCVIGGGAAGISACIPFVGRLNDVVLLEAGAEQTTQDNQAWYTGTVGGTFRTDSLTQFRLRQFGGTTGHWEGHVFPLDSIDFQERPWVPNSGWPINREALSPYYREAAELLNLPFVPDASVPSAYSPDIAHLAELLSADFEQRVFQVAPVRFAETYGPILSASKNVMVYLNSPAVRLEPNESRRMLSVVKVVTEGGKSFRVQARVFVLAAGGIENVRLLLANDLGTEHGVLGRYFSVHMLVTGGPLYLDQSYLQSLRACRWMETGQGTHFVRLALSAEIQRQHELMNCHVGIDSVAENVGTLPSILFQGRGIDVAGQVSARLRLLSEQQPSPDNRIRLGTEVDPNGTPRPHVEWRPSEADLDSVRRSVLLLGRQIAVRSAGRLSFPEVERMDPVFVTPGHHIGAARMSDDPQTGVVNGDCRMHSIANLYLAGSAVFPTSGAANPTFTIVAMSLRLAKHLLGVLNA